MYEDTMYDSTRAIMDNRPRVSTERAGAASQCQGEPKPPGHLRAESSSMCKLELATPDARRDLT
jgi:hypothetical protein